MILELEGDHEGVYVLDVSQAVASVVRAQLGARQGIPSPNGKQMAYFKPGDQLKVGVWGGGDEKEVCVDSWSQIAWMDDEHLLLFDSDDAVAIWRVAEDKVRTQLEWEEPDIKLELGDVEPDIGAMVAVRRSQVEDTYGIAWLRKRRLSPRCGDRLERIFRVAALSDDLGTAVVFDQMGRGIGFPGSIYGCRPGGQPIDLLAKHELTGWLVVRYDR